MSKINARGFDVLEVGDLEAWDDHIGGFTPEAVRRGRRVVNTDLATQYIGMTVNSLAPGKQAGYWHTHADIEELYVFLDGEGQMGLDNEVVKVAAGSVVRVGQDVWRTWRCVPESETPLRWVCIRAGGGELPLIPDDARVDRERPSPW